MPDTRNAIGVPEDVGRLMIVDHEVCGLELVEESLRKDMVVLVQGLDAGQADRVINDVAGRFDLSDALTLQARFAAFGGHRHNVGKYFMSVNDRNDYQFISPHSEGSSTIGMQLAAFFCYENSTDGGETLVMNVDDSSEAWFSLREMVTRVKQGPRHLTPREISKLKGMYRLQLPADALQRDDKVLRESPTSILDVALIDVLSKPVKIHSRILERDVFSYWDTVASIDFDSATEFEKLLRDCDLLKEPPGGLTSGQIDNAADRRIWRSGVGYAAIFKCRITRKLAPGDLIIQNNLTWTHAASNWSPGSGTRTIAAAFA